jgi:hypothetical protein
LGATTIADIEATDSKEARFMALHWPQARKEVLRLRRWTCATKRDDLDLSATQPDAADGFTYSHDLPADCLRVLEINNHDAVQYAGSYSLEGAAILSNFETIRLRYIFDNDDPATWDPLLQDAVVLLLASKAARSLTGSEAVESTLLQQYQRLALPQAGQADAQQERSAENSPLLDLIANSTSTRFRRTNSDPDGLYRDRWPTP